MNSRADISDLAAGVLDRAREAGLMIATAESCTGGLVAATLTDIAGASDIFERGFVTYSEAAKQENLGVRAETLAEFGAVSLETAGEMAVGALKASHADISVAITGIAGPGGGSPDKPVGLVCFATAVRRDDGGVKLAQSLSHTFPLEGRDAIRRASVETALKLLDQAISEAR